MPNFGDLLAHGQLEIEGVFFTGCLVDVVRVELLHRSESHVQEIALDHELHEQALASDLGDRCQAFFWRDVELGDEERSELFVTTRHGFLLR